MKTLTEEQATAAKEAIRHVLNALADDPRKFWLMGDATGSYEKLTQAAALIWGEPVEEVKKNFRPGKAEWDRYCEERERNDRLVEYCRENGITGKRE